MAGRRSPFPSQLWSGPRVGRGELPRRRLFSAPRRGDGAVRRDFFEESVPRQPISVGARLPRPCTGTPRRSSPTCGVTSSDGGWLRGRRLQPPCGTGVGTGLRSTAVAAQSWRRQRLTTTHAFRAGERRRGRPVRAARGRSAPRRPPWRIYFICRQEAGGLVAGPGGTAS
jgi:hypothetical protein